MIEFLSEAKIRRLVLLDLAAVCPELDESETIYVCQYCCHAAFMLGEIIPDRDVGRRGLRDPLALPPRAVGGYRESWFP